MSKKKETEKEYGESKVLIAQYESSRQEEYLDYSSSEARFNLLRAHKDDNQAYRAPFYHIVHVAPNMQLTKADPKPTNRGPMLGSSIGEPFASAKVVANSCVGFGGPITVTVAAEGFVDGWVALADVEEPITVKRLEVATIVPRVELRKRMK